eukprot:TRINITY_DN524_c0_g1_i1.p1 TRINITY_DN524_c0_g1~~TRINITY_DN524_c0_g1_i1.p1  ORF type:complete len:476 (-),score=110.91 TRINITY_DN524_c0_g1_i1:559-1986(-)
MDRHRRRLTKLVQQLACSPAAPNSSPRCGSCIHRHECSAGVPDMEDMAGPGQCSSKKPLVPMETASHMMDMFDARPELHGLRGEFFHDKQIFDADLELVFHKEWLFAGHTVQIPEPGMWLTLQAGKYPVLVVRGQDLNLRAFHNVCRHRGYKLVDGMHGKLEKSNFVCQYHQWSYDMTDGRLKFARDMDESFDAAAHGLLPVRLEVASSYIWVCVAEVPPDFSQVKSMIQEYAGPYDLPHSKVAKQSRIVEQGNWKLVWENNRECYHCAKNHPELGQSFPANWKQGPDTGDENAQAAQLGLPTAFKRSRDFQFRAMRHKFVKGATSMTRDGRPAISNDKRLVKSIPANADIGNSPFYHYPSTWNHWQADYAVSFRVLPISATETEVVTTWLVPQDAVQGIDYDLEQLTVVWEETNKQDQMLVERVQQGVQSPAFIPGRYNIEHESGVYEFVEWYATTMKQQLLDMHAPPKPTPGV